MMTDYSQALKRQILLEEHLPLKHNWRRPEKQKAVGYILLLILNILPETENLPSTKLHKFVCLCIKIFHKLPGCTQFAW